MNISKQGVSGCLRLRFEADGATRQTVLRVQEQKPPLKVVRAFPIADGAALVHLHNLSGGVLGGDQLSLEVVVAAQARAQLTSTGATRLYRSRGEQRCARQVNKIRVEASAVLEYLPDPLIPFAGSSFLQETSIELGPDAGLFWWEVVAPGREASGEVFQYDLLQSKLEIKAGGKLIALEQVRLEPRIRPLDSPARLGPYRYFATFYLCREGVAPEQWRSLEGQLSEVALQLEAAGQTRWGVSTLPHAGLVVRALSRQGRAILKDLPTFWRVAKLALYGQEAILPRKVY